jgi:transcriptional regulator with XRE-family HTH domain
MGQIHLTLNPMPSKYPELAAYITKHREDAGLSIPKLAALIGVTKQIVYNWEAGEVLPQVTVLEPLARAINVSYEDLYTLAGYSHPEELPSGAPYLRAKFPRATKKSLAEAERVLAKLEADEAKRTNGKPGRR